VKTFQNDFGRIERAILFIEEHFRSQPTLREIAGAIGLSEHHFQRLFKRWAGISPKRFLQFVTAVYAKELLRGQQGLLDVAYDSGLSSMSRLHDLFVNMEAVTPGEFRRRGEALIIRYGFHPSPFGECFIAVTDKGICSLEFVGNSESDASVDELKKQWKNAQIVQDQKTTKDYIDKIFSGQLRGSRPALHVKGSNFQVKVWEALLKIPKGSVVSYEALAASIGKPKAVRAVANAVGDNPVAFLIPCHRVIRKTGAIGGYHWGSGKKIAILLWESKK
jgi:AraC family transcriptional regulator, regulatory protein of adaptative response / methylated-DNA-[protein]-cysteine methyltransferase